MFLFSSIIRFLQISLFLFLFLSIGLPAQTQNNPFIVAGPGPLFYDDYSAILKRVVDDRGYINYKELQSRPNGLNQFLYQIARLEPVEFEYWNDSDKYAFWINAYHALILKSIIEHYPVSSPKDIRGFYTKKQFFLLGRKLSLDVIEQEILRKDFNDPRIHIALCKGTIGGAQLPREPYEGARLNQQLSDQSRHFLLDPQHFQIDLMNSKISISQIFQWYAKDFLENYGINKRFIGLKAPERAVMNFVLTYSSKDVSTYMYSKRFEVDYLIYNWDINDTH